MDNDTNILKFVLSSLFIQVMIVWSLNIMNANILLTDPTYAGVQLDTMTIQVSNLSGKLGNDVIVESDMDNMTLTNAPTYWDVIAETTPTLLTWLGKGWSFIFNNAVTFLGLWAVLGMTVGGLTGAVLGLLIAIWQFATFYYLIKFLVPSRFT